MPDIIDTSMLAPCGVNCAVCYAHVGMRKSGQCPGCRSEGPGKPGHCGKCRIKGCITQRGHDHCGSCGDFPCKLIKSLNSSYVKRYKISLIDNIRRVRDAGVEVFLEEDRLRWVCGKCGGAFSVQDSVCSDCGAGKDEGR